MIYSHGEAIVYNGRLVTVEGVTHHSFGTRVSFRDGRAVFSSDARDPAFGSYRMEARRAREIRLDGVDNG